MAYNSYFICDACGATYSWINHTVAYSTAIKIARSAGWKVGKKGWFCPSCQKASDRVVMRSEEYQAEIRRKVGG